VCRGRRGCAGGGAGEDAVRAQLWFADGFDDRYGDEHGGCGADVPWRQRPWAAAVSPNGATAYILNQTAATVTPVAVATGTLGTPIAIPGGSAPNDIAITPNGSTAYVANTAGQTVVPIDLATDTAGTPITLPGGSEPFGVAITPDGSTAYVTDEGSGSVTPIDLATGTLGTPIPVGANPVNIAITPDGKTAHVASDGTDTVTPISTATNTAGTPISFPGVDPFAVAITPDGSTVYATNDNSGTLTPISTATNTAGTPITVGTNPGDPAIVPDQGPSAAFTATPSGGSVSFNASGSADPDGSVASYSWSFGDGTSATTSAPTISHTYAPGGSYTATLTVTDNEGCSTTVIFTGHTVSCNGNAAATMTQTVVVPAPTVVVPPPTVVVPPPVAPAPAVSKLSVSPRRFSAAGRKVHGRCVKLSKKNKGDKACQLSIKLKATYTLNTPVTVSFKLSLRTTGRKVSGSCVKATRKNKHHAKCPRLVSVHKTITRSGVAGSNRFSLTGKLAAGTYQLTATPAGGTSRTVTFRVIG
jgi:YVTN family beta-propeller protein